jgi:hypothetical protein
MPSETPTWRALAIQYPDFVQYIVTRYGPLPAGPIEEEDYERFKVAYEAKL